MPAEINLPNRLIFMVSETDLAAIDDFRFKHRLPSRSAAIRKLIAAALAR